MTQTTNYWLFGAALLLIAIPGAIALETWDVNTFHTIMQTGTYADYQAYADKTGVKRMPWIDDASDFSTAQTTMNTMMGNNTNGTNSRFGYGMMHTGQERNDGQGMMRQGNNNFRGKGNGRGHYGAGSYGTNGCPMTRTW